MLEHREVPKPGQSPEQIRRAFLTIDWHPFDARICRPVGEQRGAPTHTDEWRLDGIIITTAEELEEVAQMKRRREQYALDRSKAAEAAMHDRCDKTIVKLGRERDALRKALRALVEAVDVMMDEPEGDLSGLEVVAQVEKAKELL